MKRTAFLLLTALLASGAAYAQEAASPEDLTPVDASAAESTTGESQPGEITMDRVTEQAKELASDTTEKVSELADTLDRTAAAQNVSAGVLKPIYQLAESMAFPAFYWVAFSLMAAGSVSYALQLVLGKVVVLANGSISVKEILSDSAGLAISLIGLVLTTQAAAENSTFAQTPSAVLSAAAVGVLSGLFLYRWGQAEEVEAARGRRKSRKKK